MFERHQCITVTDCSQFAVSAINVALISIMQFTLALDIDIANSTYAYTLIH